MFYMSPQIGHQELPFFTKVPLHSGMRIDMLPRRNAVLYDDGI